MKDIYVLSEENTKSLLEMDEVIETIENVYKEKSIGSGKSFPLIFHEFEKSLADMDIKSGTLDSMGVYGLKLVSWFGENKDKDLPALSGVVMIFDRETGLPLGLINAEHMTGMRTGAAGAIGAKYLARKDSETLLIVGAGNQASYQIRAMQSVFSNLNEIMIHDAKQFERASRFVRNFNYKKDRIKYTPVENLEAAVGKADIIVTVTPSQEALIMKDWVKKGTHFSCIGSDIAGKQEIDPEILKLSKLITDDISQSINVGEFEQGIKHGIISESEIICEIGDIILGKEKGRTSNEDITVFDSTGIGLQDIAVGYMAINKAKILGINTTVKF